MPIDIIVYAVVAAGLVFWLRNILGTRHGEERERPNPYIVTDKEDNALPLADGQAAEPMNPERRIANLAENRELVKAIDNKTAELGLIEILKADKSFNIDYFLDAAQDVFVMIVEAYAEGDRDLLKSLLSPAVYKAFEAGIDAREARGETMVTDIHAIRKAEVIDARLDGKKAFVSVKFVAQESSVTRNKDGEIISGSLEKTSQMIDLWTFGRDIKSKDPTWLVYETRADVEDDNDLIPNTK